VSGVAELPPPESAPSGWRAHLTAFGELRDTIVFGFSALYVLGYVTWALYSNDRGLGVLPPLEGQYFLAGVVPLLILVAAYALMRMTRPAETESERSRATRWIKRLYWVGPTTLAVGAVLDWVFGVDLASVLILPAILIILFVAMLTARRDRSALQWWRLPLIALLVIVASWLYATQLFPRLPAEFGGPQPTCVTLDLAATSLSRETTAALGVQSGESSSAVHSAPLWLHFNGGGFLVVSRERGRPVPNVLRLQESTVAAFTPANSCK
jgi:hypothetical protein